MKKTLDRVSSGTGGGTQSPGLMPGMGQPGMMPGMMGGMMGGMMMGGDTNLLNVVGSVEKPLRVVCKAIDLRDVNPTANIALKKNLVDNLKNSNMFDYNETKWGDLNEDEKQMIEEVQGIKPLRTRRELRHSFLVSISYYVNPLNFNYGL